MSGSDYQLIMIVAVVAVWISDLIDKRAARDSR